MLLEQGIEPGSLRTDPARMLPGLGGRPALLGHVQHRHPQYGLEPLLAVAHRGGAAGAPENTVAAFEQSRAVGFRYLETDVRATRDGVAVAFHDRTLRRVTGDRGRLADLRWEDVRRLRVAGSHPVPRLEDLLDAWPDVRWMLDLKQPTALGAMVRAVRGVGAAHRVCLTGTWDRWLDAARGDLGPSVSTALGWSSLGSLLAGRPVHRPAAGYVHLPVRIGRRWLPTPGLVARSHSLGLRVMVWGAADTGTMHRLLDAGVDGLITDHTRLLREVLVGRGSWHGHASAA